jgi:hypothetical protein
MVNSTIPFYAFNLININLGSQNMLSSNYRSFIHVYKCIQSIEDAQQMTTFINEGYMRLKPLLYPCTIEFSLMCLTVNNSLKSIFKKNQFLFSFSYSFSSGKILVKHLPIKCPIKLQLKMFSWLIVMHQSKVYLLV